MEEGEGCATLDLIPSKASLTVGHHARSLAAFLRRRRRLKVLRVYCASSRPLLAPLALAFMAGSCRQIEELNWHIDVWTVDTEDENLDIIASAIAMDPMPCLKTLKLEDTLPTIAIMTAFATGASPLLENIGIIVYEDNQVADVLTALIARSRHEACVPLRHLRFFQYVEEQALMKDLFACRLLAGVEELIMGGHGRSWMDAFVVYLEEGLAQGKPRGVKRVQAAFSTEFPSGDALMLMDVLARGGAPDLEVLDGFVEGEAVIWTSHAKWLLAKKVINCACPKLLLSSTRWRSALCPAEDES